MLMKRKTTLFGIASKESPSMLGFSNPQTLYFHFYHSVVFASMASVCDYLYMNNVTCKMLQNVILWLH